MLLPLPGLWLLLLSVPPMRLGERRGREERRGEERSGGEERRAEHTKR